MNKMVFLFCLGIGLGGSCQTIGQGVTQQNNGFSRHLESGSSETLYFYQENGNCFSSNVMLNEISARAFRHFKQNYAFVSKEEWTKTAGGFSVIFISNDSVVYHICYGPKGRFERVFTYYREENLPVNLKASIMSIYKDYAILFGSGLNDGEKMIFNVTVADKYMVKTVEISNGNVETISEYKTSLTQK